MARNRKTTKAKKVGTTASRARKTGKGSRSGKAATRVFNFNDFLLHPWNDQMKDKEIDNYNFFAFDKPRIVRSPNSAATRLAVPVRSSDDDTPSATCLCPPNMNHTGNNCVTQLSTTKPCTLHSALSLTANGQSTKRLATALDPFLQF